MNAHVKKVLENAIATKEKVNIIYLGGSKPGSSRSIAPISINNVRVRAKCYSSNSVKYFDIKKIQLPDSSLDSPVHYDDYIEKKYETIHDIFHDFCALYPNTSLTCDYNETSIYIFGYAKKGKRKHKRSISIEYSRRAPDALSFRINANFEMEYYESKTRPWRVSGTRGNAVTYSDLHRAAIAFFKMLSVFSLEYVD